MLKTPEHIRQEMHLWRSLLGPLPQAYIDFHAEHAQKTLDEAQVSQGWVIHSTTMQSDGWLDGMRLLTAVIETPKSELKKVQWHTHGAWMEKMPSGGWVLYYTPAE